MSFPNYKPLPEITPKDIEKFWNNVQVNSTDECWPWKAGVGSHGYGQMRLSATGWRVPFLSHRIAFFLKYGSDPGPCMVLHRCDFRRCNNPDHFFIGSWKDNADDRKKKGRGSHGEHRWNASVKESDVSRIRSLYQKSSRGEFNMQGLARTYGTSAAVIYKIVHGKTWTHIP